MKTKKRIQEKVIKAMAAKLAKVMHPEQIYLFGSYAWGKPTKDSDVDFCLVYREVKAKDVLSIMVESSRALKDFDEISCDVIVRDTERMERRRPFHAPLESQILRSGKLLYDASVN